MEVKLKPPWKEDKNYEGLARNRIQLQDSSANIANYMTDDLDDPDFETPGYKREKKEMCHLRDEMAEKGQSVPRVTEDIKGKVKPIEDMEFFLSEFTWEQRTNLANLYGVHQSPMVLSLMNNHSWRSQVKVKHVIYSALHNKLRKRWLPSLPKEWQLVGSANPTSTHPHKPRTDSVSPERIESHGRQIDVVDLTPQVMFTFMFLPTVINIMLSLQVRCCWRSPHNLKSTKILVPLLWQK